MLKTIDEIKKVELDAGGVVNGVDSPNLMSVDSTTPIVTDVDEVKTDEVKVVESTETKLPGAVKPKEEVKPGEELEPKPDEKVEEKVEETPAEVPVVEKLPAKEDPVEKRIGKLTKKWRTTERELEYERTKTAKLEARLKEVGTTAPTVDEPKEEDFETTVEFVQAYTKWSVDNALKAKDTTSADQVDDDTAKTASEQSEQDLEDAMIRGREKYADFDEAIHAEDLTLTQGIVDVLVESDIAEELLYYLAKNSEECAALSKLSGIKLAIKAGILEAKVLESLPTPNIASEGGVTETVVEPVKKPVKLPQAPDPITPVRTDGVTEKDPSTMSPKEYRAWRESKK